jgi:3-dehydroquinate synthase
MRIARCEFHARFADAWSSLEERFGDRTWLVVADRNLLSRNRYALSGLRRKRRQAVIDLPGGEPVKSLRRLGALASAAHAAGLGRDGLVVALGGGTIGDLAGFFAATWMRGVDWVPVATTTLAMADSAVGGKTAVDWRGLKNQIGSFHDPLAVLAVEESLASLPRRHFQAGLAEVAKSAVVADARLFGRLEREADGLVDGRSDALFGCLESASRIKARIVAKDPREDGIRAWLNFGHTVGHALEAVHRPRLLHGEAVAAGMIAASWISECLIEAPEGTTDRVEDVLRRLGALRRLSAVDLPAIWGAIASDKKIRRKRIRLVLTPRIGVATVADLPSPSLLRQGIQQMQRRCGGNAEGNAR